MKNFSFIKIFLFGLLLAINGKAISQSFLRAQGKEIVNEDNEPFLLRGMGLGGWMLQEGYMLQTAEFANAQHKIEAKIEDLIGPEGKQEFYDAWLANHVTKSDIDALKAWGFNSVRLPMHYNLFTLPIEKEPVIGEHTWLEKGFELTDSLISWCAENEMYVVLDLHATPGGQGRDEGIADYNPSKPSLWESKENRDKTVALWMKLAERYADEPWVAGYDLINEPNWDIPGNKALKDLYKELTDSIRVIDKNHIIFIEGNWFANDFTGLTPPWDDNMVYAPHKYWSINDQASIQWVLDMRERHNVPLYLGESGENSNVWFRDAIRLLEDNNIGWAWWPMKKVESIAGPLSIVKTDDYNTLLNYWKGNGPKPSLEFAKATLMEFAENIKIENCIFQKDVIDAMFRQVYSDEAIPFRTQNVQGVIYASDFDMGVLGSAYYDDEVANYQVTTGNYTSWNNGWTYRNDGVDLETCQDNINSNGYNVGWIHNDEWMQYDINVEKDAVYDVHVRLAAAAAGGQFHFQVGTADVSEIHQVASTGGWASWGSITIPNVILHKTDKKLRFYADKEGFNISSFEFIETAATTTVSTVFVSAITLSSELIELNINKPISNSSIIDLSEFTITADGQELSLNNIEIDDQNSRILKFNTNQKMFFDQVIRISYSGNKIQAADGTILKTFSNELVKNNLDVFNEIPGKIEAEDYFFQSGVQLESTTDDGGGLNIGYLDRNDFLEYNVNVTVEGNYDVEFRTASQSSAGGVDLVLVDDDGNETNLTTTSFAATGGWQNWSSTIDNIDLPSGRYTLRMIITQAPFNMNWMSFRLTDPPPQNVDSTYVKIFPNPSSDLLNIEAMFRTPHEVDMDLFNSYGKLILSKKYGIKTSIEDRLQLRELSAGIYYLLFKLEDGTVYDLKFLKLGD